MDSVPLNPWCSPLDPYAIGGATTAGHVQSTAEADVLDFD